MFKTFFLLQLYFYSKQTIYWGLTVRNTQALISNLCQLRVLFTCFLGSVLLFSTKLLITNTCQRALLHRSSPQMHLFDVCLVAHVLFWVVRLLSSSRNNFRTGSLSSPESVVARQYKAEAGKVTTTFSFNGILRQVMQRLYLSCF